MPILRSVATFIAIASGLVVLVDRFVEIPLLRSLAGVLVDWAVLLAAMALLLGLGNLAGHHGRLVANRRLSHSGQPRLPAAGIRQRFYSLALLLTLLVTLAAGLPSGTDAPLPTWLFRFVQYPLQAALFSLLAFYMASAAYRALRPGGPLGRTGLLFLLAALLVFLAQLVGQPGSLLQGIRQWLVDIPTLAAVRGLLLGIALGTTLAGLRTLLGLSRPYAPSDTPGPGIQHRPNAAPKDPDPSIGGTRP